CWILPRKRPARAEVRSVAGLVREGGEEAVPVDVVAVPAPAGTVERDVAPVLPVQRHEVGERTAEAWRLGGHGGAVGSPEGVLAGRAGEGPAALVHRTVVLRAQHQQVLHHGGTVAGPPDDVVRAQPA